MGLTVVAASGLPAGDCLGWASAGFKDGAASAARSARVARRLNLRPRPCK
jgi:hypothetical protein